MTFNLLVNYITYDTLPDIGSLLAQLVKATGLIWDTVTPLQYIALAHTKIVRSYPSIYAPAHTLRHVSVSITAYLTLKSMISKVVYAFSFDYILSKYLILPCRCQ